MWYGKEENLIAYLMPYIKLNLPETTVVGNRIITKPASDLKKTILANIGHETRNINYLFFM